MMPPKPSYDFMHRRHRRAPRGIWPFAFVGACVLLFFVLRTIIGAEDTHERPELKWGTPTPPEAFYPGFVHGHVGHFTGWTIEYLTKEKLDGGVNRKGFKFFADPLVPVEWRATLGDYRGMGYDRGHISPASDNTFSKEAMRSCFSLANMCPQAGQLNRGPWRLLEEHIRDIAREDGTEVWVVTLPLFVPDEETGVLTVQTIGEHHVFAPTHCAKCALIKRGDDLEMKAWVLPNVSDPPPFDVCAATVDSVEAIAGFNVFDALDDETESALEAKRP